MTTTPDQARELLDGATPGPWIPSRSGYIGSAAGVMIHDGHVLGDTDADTCLIAAAPELAQTIAGMTWQHAVEVYNADAKCWIRSSEWISHREVAEQDIDAYSRAYGGAPTHLVRRLVGPVEVIDGE